jgi:hypothetical protein
MTGSGQTVASLPEAQARRKKQQTEQKPESGL